MKPLLLFYLLDPDPHPPCGSESRRPPFFAGTGIRCYRNVQLLSHSHVEWTSSYINLSFVFRCWLAFVFSLFLVFTKSVLSGNGAQIFSIVMHCVRSGRVTRPSTPTRTGGSSSTTRQWRRLIWLTTPWRQSASGASSRSEDMQVQYFLILCIW